jgi:hypothetical protein
MPSSAVGEGRPRLLRDCVVLALAASLTRIDSIFEDHIMPRVCSHVSAVTISYSSIVVAIIIKCRPIAGHDD